MPFFLIQRQHNFKNNQKRINEKNILRTQTVFQNFCLKTHLQLKRILSKTQTKNYCKKFSISRILVFYTVWNIMEVIFWWLGFCNPLVGGAPWGAVGWTASSVLDSSPFLEIAFIVNSNKETPLCRLLSKNNLLENKPFYYPYILPIIINILLR